MRWRAGAWAQAFWPRGPSKVTQGSEGPTRSPALNDRGHPYRPGWWRGGRLSLTLGLWCPQSPALRHQAPWELLLRGRPRVMVIPQEAGCPDPPAVGRLVGRAEVRALPSGSVGATVLMQGAFEGRQWLGGPCPFSHPE